MVEPGKALAQPTMAMAMRVLEVRRGPELAHPVEVVVDSSVSDLPAAALFPHRVSAMTPQAEFRALPDGEGRILGRNCMETDILAPGVGIPGWVSRGTLLFVCDAGGYDASMPYRFGAGIRTGA